MGNLRIVYIPKNNNVKKKKKKKKERKKEEEENDNRLKCSTNISTKYLRGSSAKKFWIRICYSIFSNFGWVIQKEIGPVSLTLVNPNQTEVMMAQLFNGSTSNP